MTFDEFAAAELPALARYARVLTGDRQRAHDVLADALVSAQLRWKRIGAMEHPAAYVRRIVTTTFLGERRRWSARHVALTATGEAPDTAGSDPTTAVDDREQLAELLSALPAQQRAAVVLRYYLGLPDQQIADELGCAPVTVRSYISRGLAAMRISGGRLGVAEQRTGSGADPAAGTGPEREARGEARRSDGVPVGAGTERPTRTGPERGPRGKARQTAGTGAERPTGTGPEREAAGEARRAAGVPVGAEPGTIRAVDGGEESS